MTLRWACCLASLLFATVESGQAQETSTTPTDDALVDKVTVLDPSEWGIGETVADLPFVDLEGNASRLSDYADQAALVVVIRDVGCPVGQRYGLRLAEIEARFAPQGVAFLYVNCSPQDSAEECAAEVTQYGLSGRYARDHEGVFGSHLRVRTTTDVFVLDQFRRLRYRGAVDDQVLRGITRPEVKQPLLTDALERVLTGRRVMDSATAAPGCLLDFDLLPRPIEPGPSPVWFGQVEGIVQRKCQSCHREGGGGPFELLEYQDVFGPRVMVQKVVSERSMPPWYATDDSGPFCNDYRLTPQERMDLLRWIQNSCPQGNPEDRLPPRSYEHGWTIGEPDLIVPLPRDVPIPAIGVVDYLYYETDVVVDEDRWVVASQILPTHAGVVHHVLVHQQVPGSGRWEFFDSYLPGKPATLHAEGSGMLLRAGTRLRFGMHYTPIGEELLDRTSIGFKFAKELPATQVRGKIVAIGSRFVIPPGAEDFRLVSEMTVPIDVQLRKVMPHMHLRGRSSMVDVFFPDGTQRKIVEVPRFNPDWQIYYELAEPLDLPAGSRVQIVSVWDNSANNPYNPDPTATVRRGSQIWDEMGGAYIEWSFPRGSLKGIGDFDPMAGDDDDVAEQEKRDQRREERRKRRAEQGGGGGDGGD